MSPVSPRPETGERKGGCARVAGIAIRSGGVVIPSPRMPRRSRLTVTSGATLDMSLRDPPQGMRWQRGEPSCAVRHGCDPRTSARLDTLQQMPFPEGRRYRDSQAVAALPLYLGGRVVQESSSFGAMEDVNPYAAYRRR